MAGKTFEQYAAEYAKAPYPFPMPGGASILIPMPTLKAEHEAVAAATAASTLAGGLLAGLGVYAGDEADAAAIAEAWGTLPVAALNEAVTEMRDYFGTKNS